MIWCVWLLCWRLRAARVAMSLHIERSSSTVGDKAPADVRGVIGLVGAVKQITATRCGQRRAFLAPRQGVVAAESASSARAIGVSGVRWQKRSVAMASSTVHPWSYSRSTLAQAPDA